MRKKKKRNINKRNIYKIDYVIMALACLVLLNFGAIGIGAYKNYKDPMNIDKEKTNIFANLDDSLEGTLEFFKSFARAFSSIVKGKDDIIVSTDISKEDDHEYKADIEKEAPSVNDIIIKNLHEYESLIIIKDSGGVASVENIPDPIGVKKISVKRDDPYILMYHTHATESFNHFAKENYRTSNRDDNVVGLGDIMATVLEANGHKVNHSDIIHDLPSYNKSYSRSLNTVNTEKEKSDNLNFFLDIHRNAIANDSPAIERIKKESRTVINGKTLATFSLVVGPDSPNKEEVLNFAKYIKAVSDSIYPGLCTQIIIKPIGKYNQHLSDYSALIEMGYHFNDLEEVREGTKLVAEVLSYAFDGLINE